MLALAISEEPRCLTSIAATYIGFNLPKETWRKFETREEIEAFRKTWEYHFFGLETLKIIEVP